MYFRPFRRRPRYTYTVTDDLPTLRHKRRNKGPVFVLLISFIIVLIVSLIVSLRGISLRIAVSDAQDAMIASINTAIIQIMRDGNYSPDSFVSFEKSDDGTVTLISSNIVQINALSAELLGSLIGAEGNHKLIIKVPAGNLTGITFLMGRGADIPVEVVVLTSSKVEFTNNIVSAGINQTKHQINLRVIVDIDVIVPWGIESAEVVTEVLIADTVLAGRVPDTYLNMK